MEKIFRLSEKVNEYGKTMCSFDEICQIIKFDKTTQKVCEALRGGNLDEDREKKLKEYLKTIEFNSITETHRRRENIKEFTGYLCVDLDDAGVDYDKLREDLANDTTLNPTLMFTSPRGKLKMVLHLSQLHNATEEEFDDYYKQCVIYIAEKYGIVADTMCKNPVCLCYLAHDDNPYFNPDTPLCAIPFYPVGSEEVVTTYGYLANDKEKGVKTYNGSGYNDDMYADWLAKVKDDLVVDDNGNYIYNTKREKVFIGSVSGGTAVDHGVGFMGYALKFRLSVCAMWLYGNNTARAQQLINDCFADARDNKHPWNRCCQSHSRFKPEKDVLLWLLKTFEFKSLFELPKTTFEFAQEIRAEFKQRDATLAERWHELNREYQFPKVLNDIMNEKNLPDEYKDIRLYSALAVFSGFAGKSTVAYNGKETGLNLTLNVIGSSASGKGEMSHQAATMLKSMDEFALEYNNQAYKQYKKELFLWKQKASQQTSTNGFDLAGEEPDPPTVLINQTNMTTSKGWASILKQNNGKMILMNTEYSNLAKMENGKYGGLLSQMKNIFDNDPIGNISSTELAKGNIETVLKPNCGVLLSGTFGQFHDLYTSFEDGLLTRSLYYIVPERGFGLLPIKRGKQSEMELEMERFFVGWHLRGQFDCGTCYVLLDRDFEKVKGWVDPFIVEHSNEWDTGDEVGGACRSLLYRFPHIVFKVAALLQDLKGYEDNCWNKDDDRTPLEMLWQPITYFRSGPQCVLTADGKYTADDYVKAQNNDFGFIADPMDREVFEQGSTPVRLEPIWLEAAWKLLMPSLLYGLRMLGTYRKEDNAVANVNPLKGQAKYMALELCGETFRFVDYKKMLDLVRKRDTSDATVTKYLKQLYNESFVERENNGMYSKASKVKIK